MHYPGGALTGINADTGIMLTLHNWGGTDCIGTADPQTMADRFNVIALCVNYLQSGPKDSIEGPEPYDFGYLQALDAIRAVYFVYSGLVQADRPFARDRIYCTGGSGGGNVSLMANKLAPRTFACVIDLCGMKKLTDDVAFDQPGGSDLNARYVRDATHPFHLSQDAQELRFVGNPDHLAIMKKLGAEAKILVVHGTQDTTCPFADAEEMVAWMTRARLDVTARFISPADLDGTIFTSAGHALGNRTKIVETVAGEFLSPHGPRAAKRMGTTDFDRREMIRYPTRGGEFVIDYALGYPVGRFEPRPRTPKYQDHASLATVIKENRLVEIRSIADWESRKGHILGGLEQVMGEFPSPLRRVPLQVEVLETVQVGKLVRKKISLQSDPDDRVLAYLFLPPLDQGIPRPAVLCLHQTIQEGKAEPAGLAGDPALHYALELAERGYVTLAPDYPSLGEHDYDFDARHGYASGTMKGIWDNVRALDFLETLPEVDAGRIGCIGHSLGGHNALFTAVFEPRIKVVVSSCGFSSMAKDDLPSWTGPRYMPRIETVFGNDLGQLPFDFHEIVAAIAPRAVFVSACQRDDDFDVTGVREVMRESARIFALYGCQDKQRAIYPDAPHSFPRESRQAAYDFLDRQLANSPEK